MIQTIQQDIYHLKNMDMCRFPYLKELGDESGGRIFLYDSALENVQSCIDYIEQSKP